MAVETGEIFMSLKVRFRFDGKCALHSRYDPACDGLPQHGKWKGCDSLYVIYLYTKIAKRRPENSPCIVARFPRGREECSVADSSSQASESEAN